MRLTSPEFTHGLAIPKRFTCEGDDISPEFSWVDIPKNVVSFALILHDPDAPRPGGFTHWAVYDIPRSVNSLPEGLPKEASLRGTGLQGKNDSGSIGYMGPCPPSGRHRYIATLFALNAKLDLEPGASHRQVTAAIKDKIIAQAELMGTYQKSGARAA
jgi:hypothetical protein